MPGTAVSVNEVESAVEVLEGGGVTSPEGFRAAGVCCGLKQGSLDLALLLSDRPATVGGVFTQNKIQAAPVIYSRRICSSGVARAIVANSSNANACTGAAGLRDAQEMAAVTAEELGLLSSQVLVASTGVIGVPLQMDAIRTGIPRLVEELGPSDEAAAQAILTTDTFPKRAAVKVSTSAGEVTIGGVAKGAGMIQPNMATTFGFITTDAAISPEVTQAALAAAIEASFNRVTVDGDTSTNDCAFLLANGASDVALEEGTADLAIFQAGLEQVCVELAKMLVRDGEGATKLVEVVVEGAADEEEARQAAFTIANSPLVKTASLRLPGQLGARSSPPPAAPRSKMSRVGHSTGPLQRLSSSPRAAWRSQAEHQPRPRRELRKRRTSTVSHPPRSAGDGAATVWTS